MSLKKLFILSLISLFALQSCSVYQVSKTEQDIMPIDPSFQFNSSQLEYTDLGEWWKLFQSEELNELVQKALIYNFDIQQARLAIEQQKATLTGTRNSDHPSLSGSLSATGSQTKDTGSSTNLSLSLDASYTVDIFGQDGFQLSAAELAVLKSIESYRAQQTTVVGNVVSLWLTIKSLEARIQLTKKQIDNDTQSIEFVSLRYQSGLSSQTEVLQARQQALSNKLSLPDLETSLSTSITALKLIVGEYPEISSRTPSADFDISLPEIQPGVPSHLMKRRTDIRSALLDIRIADNQVGNAVAAKYPALNLSASLGTKGSSPGNLFNPEYLFWNLASSISTSIIDSNGREAEIASQKANLETKILAYRSAVLSAFKEVVDALTKIEAQHRVIELALQKATISEQLLKQSLMNYTEGLGDWADVLDAQSQFFTARDSLISAKKTLISDNIDLLTALGESWVMSTSEGTDNIEERQ